jgi:hypothetical protein
MKRAHGRPCRYLWNEEQTEAYLSVAGKNLDVTWTQRRRVGANCEVFGPEFESM